MKKILMLFGVVLAICAASCAFAEDDLFAPEWWGDFGDYPQNEEGVVYMYDKKHLVYDGYSILSLERGMYQDPGLRQYAAIENGLPDAFQPLLYQFVHFVEYCVSDKTYRTKSTMFFDKKGMVLHDVQATAKWNRRWKDIEPGSPEENHFNYYKKILNIKR